MTAPRGASDLTRGVRSGNPWVSYWTIPNGTQATELSALMTFGAMRREIGTKSRRGSSQGVRYGTVELRR
jgi:hypothetical protein